MKDTGGGSKQESREMVCLNTCGAAWPWANAQQRKPSFGCGLGRRGFGDAVGWDKSPRGE